MEFNQQAYQAAKKDTVAALKVLNNHLLSHTYLVGNQVTLADIVVCVALADMYQKVFAPKFISNYGNVNRWFKTCINQPTFATVLGKVVFATKEIQAPKPKKEKKSGSKKGKGQKQQGKQQEKKKKKKRNRYIGQKLYQKVQCLWMQLKNYFSISNHSTKSFSILSGILLILKDTAFSF